LIPGNAFWDLGYIPIKKLKQPFGRQRSEGSQFEASLGKKGSKTSMSINKLGLVVPVFPDTPEAQVE
jgi:hypothetical protein